MCGTGMDTEFLVQLSVTLEPVGCPYVLLQLPGHCVTQRLDTTTRFDFEFRSPATKCRLKLQHLDKSDNDQNTAVIVKAVDFFGISDPRLIWAGVYCPQYPEPWYSQQATKPASELSNTNYLGWNGLWSLDFDVPVFTWLHRQLNLGWLYQ